MRTMLLMRQAAIAASALETVKIPGRFWLGRVVARRSLRGAGWERGAGYPQLLHPRLKRVRVELELRRRIALALDAPVPGFEGAEDVLQLHVHQRPRAAPGGGRRHRGFEALPKLLEKEHGCW